MDCWLQASCSGVWEFAVPYSNPVILTTKNIFWVFYSIFGISIKFRTFSKKRKIVIGNVFPKLVTVQGLVTPLTIQPRLKTSFDSQRVKLWGEMIWKTSPWLKFVIIGLFVNAWTAHSKYPVPDCESLPFPIQIQLS